MRGCKIIFILGLVVLIILLIAATCSAFTGVSLSGSGGPTVGNRVGDEPTDVMCVPLGAFGLLICGVLGWIVGVATR